MENNDFEREVTQNHEAEAEKVRKQLPYICESAASIVAWANLVNQKFKNVLGIERDDEL